MEEHRHAPVGEEFLEPAREIYEDVRFKKISSVMTRVITTVESSAAVATRTTHRDAATLALMAYVTHSTKHKAGLPVRSAIGMFEKKEESRMEPLKLFVGACGYRTVSYLAAAVCFSQRFGGLAQWSDGESQLAVRSSSDSLRDSDSSSLSKAKKTLTQGSSSPLIPDGLTKSCQKDKAEGKAIRTFILGTPMSGLELVPIGTILGLLIDQVISMTIALNDVLIEKECFKTLSSYLFDISPILVELQNHELNEQAVRRTLEFLKEDCEKAESLVQKYKNSGKFYNILFCRRIANEMQDATRAIGRSLAMLPLANTEVLSAISEKVNRLQAAMQNVEYVASHSSLAILEKLDKGIREERHDHNFRNSMLEQIASSVPFERTYFYRSSGYDRMNQTLIEVRFMQS
ncbi:hypothetical protein KSP40_PGU012115 [Platanthera guangdongensis]|uniref:Uncharacterized protein n=1 Tax=Platanthera guangdongensis TaxID=2320717 RepID=A0ABR2LYZ4_9ASPA